MASLPGWLISLSLLLDLVICFNIDIENVLVFGGPNTGSYFGFSSALSKDNDGVWLTVGAPRDNSSVAPDIPFTGNLYRCPVNFLGDKSSVCTQVLNAVQSETKEPDMTYTQSNQQLGANVYIDQDRHRTFACSSLHKRTIHEKEDNLIYVVGRCSYSNDSRPTERPTYFKFRVMPMYDSSAWRWGMAQIGFSFSPLDDYPAMNGVLGSPGVYDLTGGFVLVDTNDAGPRGYKEYSIQANADIAGGFKRGALLGYSVAAGKFGTRRMPWILAGAPHYSNTQGHVGKVLVIDLPGDDSYEVEKAFDGKQPGAGFGSSMVVTDINGDGLDDLFVGSPYFTGQETDEGLVNVFYGTGDDEMLRATLLELKGSRKRSGRFGLSMTALGDINDDKFNDLAVGAPYEEEQRGAVYIYNGNTGDLNTDYSQRIAASELDNGLRAFGFSISRPFDSDNNQYNDISVGAYLSDQAVLLRSRPIVRIGYDMRLDPMSIRLNSSGLTCQISEDDIQPCVNVIMCFNFTGKGVDRGLNINFTLRADTDRTEKRKTSRILLYNSDKTFSSSMTDIFHLKSAQTNCKAVKARVPSISREFFREIGQPIKFKMNFSLSSEPVPGDVLPILDNVNERTSQTQGNISTGCRSGICRTDMRLSAVFFTETQSDVIIVGRTQEVSVRVDISNLGNPAYGATVLLTSSDNAAYTDAYQTVGEGSELVVCNQTFPGSMGDNDALCEFERPFFKQQSAVFRALFNVSREQMLPPGADLSELRDSVTINVSTRVNTPSREIDDLNNRLTKKLDVRLLADIEITSTSDPDQKKISDDASGSLSFTQAYEVYNKGPSPLPGTTFIMDIPMQYQGQEKEDISFESSTGNCRFLPFDKEPPPASFVENPDSNVLSRRRREALPQEQQNPRSSFTNMSCTEPGVECIHLECSMGLLEINEIFTVHVHINLTESKLEFGKGVVGIRYSTSATVHPPQRLFIPWSNVKSDSVKLDIYPATVKPVEEKIALWIIIVGCLAGILLFVLLGLVLWKLGFFKRNKRDKVQDWKRKSGYNQRRTQRISGRQAGSVKSRQGGSVKSRMPSAPPDWIEEKNPNGFE